MSNQQATQEAVDRFYWSFRGPCCAGCDWWGYLNLVAGQCTRSAPVAAEGRWALLGVAHHSLPPEAGHVMTPRDYVCGDFRDSFDWSSLPAAYQRRVGVEGAPRRG